MANLTIAVDDEVLRRARIRALEQGRSVNAILRDYLEAFSARQDVRARAIEHLLDLSDRSESGRGTRRWSREDLHER